MTVSDENTIERLDTGELVFRLDGASITLDASEATRLLLLGLERLDWTQSTEMGLKIDDNEPKMLPEVVIRDTLERIRASGTRPQTSIHCRTAMTAPWMSQDRYEHLRAYPPVVPRRRFVKDKAPTPDPRNKNTPKPAVRKPEIIDKRLFEDPEEQLRYEIRHAYLTSVPLTQRETWPMPATYVIMPSFLRDLDSHHGQVSRAQMIAAALDVVCGRVADVNSRQTKIFRLGSTRTTAPITRSSDGAIAWRAYVSTGSAAARRIMWWKRRDNIIELARLATHDDMEMPER